MWWLLASCASLSETISLHCEVRLTGVSPISAAPGDTVVVTGTPLSTSWDTVLQVNGTRAAVLNVDRSTCTDCDSCRSEAGCSDGCEDCDSCDDLCTAECIETVSFRMPTLMRGPAQLSLINAYGDSNSLTMEVLPEGLTLPDTGG